MQCYQQQQQCSNLFKVPSRKEIKVTKIAIALLIQQVEGALWRFFLNKLHDNLVLITKKHCV